MNHNIVARNERIHKISLSLPELPKDTIVVNDITNALEHIPGTRWTVLSNTHRVGFCSPQDLSSEPKSFDAAVVRISPNKDRLRVILSLLNGVLNEGALVWLVGGNDEGIKSFAKTAFEYIETAETIDIRHRARLLKAQPSSTVRTFTSWISTDTITLAEKSVDWSVMPGVFAKGRMDSGTEFLLDVLSRYTFKRTYEIADFACGTGVIARWLSEQFPDAQIDASDADSWSVELTKRNAPSVNSFVADGWSDTPRDRRYDVIVSNPPVHIGKEADYSVLIGLLRDAKPLLHFRGRILMVIQHHVPIQRIAKEEEYRICEVVEHNSGYKVWRLGMRS